MQALQAAILQQGQVLSERVLKVDSFLNHQVQPQLIMEIGEAMAARFRQTGVTKVLTIEASGIHFAFAAALALQVPFVYAKKKKAITQADAVYSAAAYSFTRQETYQITVSKPFLADCDRVLIVDDILAEGAGVTGLMEIVAAAGAQLVGACFAVEKSFQAGRKKLDVAGVPVYSLARIAKMSPETGVEFMAVESETEGAARC